jgi:hypothetical protein
MPSSFAKRNARPAMRGSSFFVAALIAPAAVWPSFAAANEAEDVFPVAVAALKEQLTAIRSLALNWEHAVDATVTRGGPADGPRVASIACQARLDGERCRLEMTLWDGSGTCLGKTLTAYDGRLTFAVDFEKASPEKMASLSRTKGNAMLPIITPAAFIGLRFLTFDSNNSLAALIDRADRASLRLEMRGGSTLLMGALPDVELFPSKAYRVEFVLDSSVDWLPRSLQARPHVSPNPPAGDEDHYTHRLECLEFSEFDDALAGARRRLPTLCQESMAGRTTLLRVTSAAINVNLPAADFTISPASGTRVLDFAVSPGKAPLASIEGGPAAQAALLAQRVDQAMRAAAPAAVEVEAVQAGQNSMWWRALFWCSLMVLALWAVQRIRR